MATRPVSRACPFLSSTKARPKDLDHSRVVELLQERRVQSRWLSNPAQRRGRSKRSISFASLLLLQSKARRRGTNLKVRSIGSDGRSDRADESDRRDRDGLHGQGIAKVRWKSEDNLSVPAHLRSRHWLGRVVAFLPFFFRSRSRVFSAVGSSAGHSQCHSIQSVCTS
jgi:hypothetical protein